MTPAESASADSAWVVIDTPLEPQALADFCRDLERLYRINPYLEFRAWRHAGPDCVDIACRNLSINREFNLQCLIHRTSEYEFALHYNHGIKRATHFRIEPASTGSRLRITDHYHVDTAGAPADTGEVDRSLHAWGVALRDYLQRHQRWGKYALWRWYMRHIWVPMKPSARRITFIILMVTLAEIALFALVMAIYWIEKRS